MHKINQVVIGHRTAMGYSLRKFAEALNSQLINTDVSHATVARWEDESSHAEPDLRFLFECLATYQDWRRTFAVDCFTSMFPDLVESGVVTFHLPKVG
jgi:transcriptional regulator with XRE-family HTH domain